MALENAKTEADAALPRDGDRGLAYENSFSGALSFLRRPYTKDLSGVDLAAAGVPFDHAVRNRPGTRLGPRAIREASTLQTCDPPSGWGGDPLSEFAVADYGDLVLDDAGIWPDDDMERIDHGTMFYKAVKQGLIDPKRSVQVGIRTVNDDNFGVPTIDAREAHLSGPEAVARKIKCISGDHPTYLSFDIDALDPGVAPGSGTPDLGGLSRGQVAIISRDIAGVNVVGGEGVKVSPPYDTTGATAVAGAHVAMEVSCLWAWKQRGGVA